ncbi:MAG TPA: DUF4870 domain-containing protein [Verrucomicrobiae bacterium]|nr:DUF4870 domain-containing protein [Verrucomicrobiae bacterium]
MQAQISAEERNWAMAAHLSALIAVIGFPFGHLVGPFVVYLAKGNEMPFVGQHAKASLNYQITASIAAMVAIFVAAILFVAWVAVAAATSRSDAGSAAAGLSFLTFGLIAAAVVLAFIVVSIVFIIQATMAASEGRPYEYPFAIRFLR